MVPGGDKEQPPGAQMRATWDPNGHTLGARGTNGAQMVTFWDPGGTNGAQVALKSSQAGPKLLLGGYWKALGSIWV